MSAPAIPQDDLRERIVAAVRDAKKPVTFKALATKAKTTGGLFQAALESAIAAGQVHRWPDRGRSQYFWNVPPEQSAREAVLTAAAAKALPKPELTKAASRKVPGFPMKALESLVNALIAENQLQKVPAFSSNAKLLIRFGDSEAYFNAARAFIEKKFHAAGFDPAGLFTAHSSSRDTLTGTQVDAAALILESVRSLEPVKGVPVSTLRLRNYLPNLSKREFDAAALELRKKQEVFLSQHSDPHNLSEEDKTLLIDGQDGTYYVAIAIR